jgi:hypothetical protein
LKLAAYLSMTHGIILFRGHYVTVEKVGEKIFERILAAKVTL